MGLYVNPGNEEFYNASLRSKIYVDKTEMIKFTNSQLFGEHKNICVSRPRRFGKSIAANMLVAYYSRGCDSKELFEKFKIAEDAGFEEHLNKYNVIHLNMQQFLGRTKTIDEMLELLTRKVTRELIVFLRRSGCICFRCGSLLFLLLMGGVEAFDIFQRMYLVVIPAGQNRIGITET